MSKEEKAMLVNADRFFSVSGQKSYYYDRMDSMQREIERLTTIFNANYFKKKEWKRKYKDIEYNLNRQIINLQKELNLYKSKVKI